MDNLEGRVEFNASFPQCRFLIARLDDGSYLLRTENFIEHTAVMYAIKKDHKVKKIEGGGQVLDCKNSKTLIVFGTSGTFGVARDDIARPLFQKYIKENKPGYRLMMELDKY